MPLEIPSKLISPLLQFHIQSPFLNFSPAEELDIILFISQVHTLYTKLTLFRPGSKDFPSLESSMYLSLHATYQPNVNVIWSSNTQATWCKELTHWKRPWCWKMEGRRKRGWRRTRWLDGITNAMGMGLSKLWEIVKAEKPDMLQSGGQKQLDATERLNNNSKLRSETYWAQLSFKLLFTLCTCLPLNFLAERLILTKYIGTAHSTAHCILASAKMMLLMILKSLVIF